jgi:hypothetical protein
MTERENMLMQALMFSLSRAVRGAEHEGTGEICESVGVLGFENLDDDVREEMLALATYWGWSDGPEYFQSLTKEATDV